MIRTVICKTQAQVHCPSLFSFVTFIDAMNDKRIGIMPGQVAQNRAGGKTDIGAAPARIGHHDNVYVLVTKVVDNLMPRRFQRARNILNKRIATAIGALLNFVSDRHFHCMSPSQEFIDFRAMAICICAISGPGRKRASPALNTRVKSH